LVGSPLQLDPDPPHRQTPPVHSSLGSQTVEQSPQWLSSVSGLWQVTPQQIWLLVQLGPLPPQLHEPVSQVSPGSQAVPQEPQCSSLVWRFTHWLLQQFSPPPQSPSTMHPGTQLPALQ
jgi:hypothetical protein